MQSVPPIKRGDTFALGCLALRGDGTPEDLSAIDLRAQIRLPGTRFSPEPVIVDELVVTKSDQTTSPGEFALHASPDRTALWKAGDEVTPVVHLVDIQKSIGTMVISSETFGVPVVRDITHD